MLNKAALISLVLTETGVPSIRIWKACFRTPQAPLRISRATSTLIIGSATYQENKFMINPASRAPTEPRASPMICR
ncbi:hypothetical protein D3C85_1628410 [compost metagenome]